LGVSDGPLRNPFDRGIRPLLGQVGAEGTKYNGRQGPISSDRNVTILFDGEPGKRIVGQDSRGAATVGQHPGEGDDG
jgi:hypothetical protein